MFSWITGPRITNVIEDLQPEINYESTFIEEPETPAHQFAVKAFKQALFGTPAPEDVKEGSKQAERKAKLNAANARVIDLPMPKQDAAPSSPSKLPGGILMTPGTANKGRKTVSFGSQVLDNEGKRGNISKSGIPNDCPGKFPSPWTPGTQLNVDVGSDKKPRTKLTAALLDARTATQPKSGQKPKARDDSDITIDLGAPRSESGRYWKEQYENYAERSEKEMKKVIAKQQLAKKFAMKKDGEVTELATKLEQERKRFRQRERELEQQNKDYQERLRQALAESTSASIEVAALKARVASLEKSIAIPSSELQQSKASFQIYEDLSKEPLKNQEKQEKQVENSFAPSFSMASYGKENSSPTARRNRQQALPTSANKPSISNKAIDTDVGASIVLGKSPGVLTKSSKIVPVPEPTKITSERTPQSPLETRQADPINRKPTPKSPNPMMPSSPLPMPSPDPWMDMDEISIPQIDRMAMPGYSGDPYSRPAWNPPPRQHRTSKSVSGSKQLGASSNKRLRKEKASLALETPELPLNPAAVNTGPGNNAHSQLSSTNQVANNRSNLNKAESHAQSLPIAQSFDVSNNANHQAGADMQIKQDKIEQPPIDRKEQARRRLEERKKLRKTGS